ncbi:toll/interleukin-1 receptor domain-containing protein [Vibrio diabolicus]|uniref:toll/interleukin-1 receptor domain-containing protein n=1 Tax=Vibrio diabolicus TaxID=50719 RepID=UPI00215C5E62|nr:TIR domain-containing protein [Vibrio diabolicus]MCR9308820.1 TIR domain-containing protein [Vibrio diabolicus]
MSHDNCNYLISLSFAGEDREYVDSVASGLKNAGISVFYDKYEQASLWGKDLYQHLTDVYQNRSRYVVMFISEHYARKLWTSHEKRMAQARAFKESREYILPIKFDDTQIPDIPDTIGYLDAREYTPEEIVKFIKEKLKSDGVTITKQQSLSDAQLKNQADDLIQSIRHELRSHELQVERLRGPSRSNLTEDEFSERWEAHTRKRAQLEKWVLNNYSSNYQSKAIILKNELMQRLNLKERDLYFDTVYENPVNTLGVSEVISDLEKLSMMLDVNE